MPKQIMNDKLNLNSIKIDATTGFLHTPVIMCRSGIQDYVGFELGLTGDDAKKIFNVLRHPDDVLHPDSVKTYTNLPVTDDHPSEGWVHIDNVKALQKGQVSNITEDTKDDEVILKGDMVITDADLISKVNSGKVEVSVGYSYKLEREPGEYKGVNYDFKYTDITANHLSVVDAGRCGETCKITNDKKYDIIDAENQTKQGVTVKVTINGKEFDLADDVVEAIMAERKSIDGEIEGMKKEGEGSSEALTAKIDTLEEKLNQANDAKMSDTDLEKLITERAELLAFAKTIVNDAELPTCPNAIKLAVVEKHFGKAFDGKSDAYIAARFEMVQEDLAAHDASVIALAKDLDSKTKVSNDADKKVNDARVAYLKRKGL
jgi:hypothetical protein